MAMTITVLNSTAAQWPRPMIAGRFPKCALVRFSFGTGDTYATNGTSVASEILRVFGSYRMVHLIPVNPGSDADITTGWCKASLDTVNQKVKLFLQGRTTSVAVAEGTEVANGTDIAALTHDAWVFCDN